MVHVLNVETPTNRVAGTTTAIHTPQQPVLTGHANTVAGKARYAATGMNAILDTDVLVEHVNHVGVLENNVVHQIISTSA